MHDKSNVLAFMPSQRHAFSGRPVQGYWERQRLLSRPDLGRVLAFRPVRVLLEVVISDRADRNGQGENAEARRP